MRHAIEVGQGIPALILEHELESAKSADAVYGGRLKNGNDSAIFGHHQHLQFGGEISDNVGGGVAFAAPLVRWLGGQKDQSGIRRTAGEAEAHYGERAHNV